MWSWGVAIFPLRASGVNVGQVIYGPDGCPYLLGPVSLDLSTDDLGMVNFGDGTMQDSGATLGCQEDLGMGYTGDGTKSLHMSNYGGGASENYSTTVDYGDGSNMGCSGDEGDDTESLGMSTYGDGTSVNYGTTVDNGDGSNMGCPGDDGDGTKGLGMVNYGDGTAVNYGTTVDNGDGTSMGYPGDDGDFTKGPGMACYSDGTWLNYGTTVDGDGTKVDGDDAAAWGPSYMENGDDGTSSDAVDVQSMQSDGTTTCPSCGKDWFFKKGIAVNCCCSYHSVSSSLFLRDSSQLARILGAWTWRRRSPVSRKWTSHLQAPRSARSPFTCRRRSSDFSRWPSDQSASDWQCLTEGIFWSILSALTILEQFGNKGGPFWHICLWRHF